MNKYLSLVTCSLLFLAACGGSPTANLSISGSPNTDLSAPSISFGTQNLGTVSDVQTITLSNTGSAELRITGIAVAAPFAETDNCPSSLAAGATCTINVTFAPDIEGDFSGNVSITDNAKGSPQTVALTGTGVAQPQPGCTPIGATCGPGLPRCCAAPFPLHSACSSQTGRGRCLEF
jgi:Protein of unknown function (DUF1573)